MRLLSIILLAFVFISCSSDEDKLYEMATEKMLDRLKSPSSAIFHRDKTEITIEENAIETTTLLETNPDMWSAFYNNNEKVLNELDPETREEYEKQYKDTIYQDLGTVKLVYEAENSYGALLKDEKKFEFVKTRFSDGSVGEWK